MVKSESDIIDTIHTGQVITDENGTQYFVCGKNRIKISEHFAAGGRPIGDLIVDFLIGFETNGTEEGRHGQLLLTIDVCVHDIVDVSSKLNPRALEGNDTCGIQLCAVGMDAGAKEYAGRTVQLRNDNALCTIDNKRTILGHIRDRTEENILDDGAEVLVVRVGTIKFEFGL